VFASISKSVGTLTVMFGSLDKIFFSMKTGLVFPACYSKTCCVTHIGQNLLSFHFKGIACAMTVFGLTGTKREIYDPVFESISDALHLDTMKLMFLLPMGIEEKWTPMHYMMATNNLSGVMKICENKSSLEIMKEALVVDNKGFTAFLTLLIYHENTETRNKIIDYLLAHMTSIDLPDHFFETLCSIFCQQGHNGFSPLHIFARDEKDVKYVEFFFKNVSKGYEFYGQCEQKIRRL